MKVAIFGGTGFVGKRVVNLLRGLAYSFLEISRNGSFESSIAGDITDPASLDEIKEEFETVIICSAALPRRNYTAGDLNELIDTNIRGIINIVQWAKSRNASRVIYCSTRSMVPGDRKSSDEVELIDITSHYPYTVSKAAGEHFLMGFCREHQINFFVLRISSVYGPGMKHDVIQTIIYKVRTGEKFTLRNRNIETDLVHVDDVAAAIIACLLSPRTNQIINISSGQPIRVYHLVELINRLMNCKPIEIEVVSDAPVDVKHHSKASLVSLINRDPIALESGLSDMIKLLVS